MSTLGSRLSLPTAPAGSKDRSDLLGRIGGTPLLRLRTVGSGLPPGVELYGKAEHLNPTGSLKDRPVRAMILAGEASGRLTRDRILLDATSGNAGIAYAMLGAALGYRVTLCLPQDASPERKRILRICGATLVETDPLEKSDGAQRVARAMAMAEPDRYFHPDQYQNEANWRAHFETTGPEVWDQTGGRVTHFVAGLGTSGTFIGTARSLKARKPSLYAVSVQPEAASHRLVGMKHMASALVPGIYDPSVADEDVSVSTGEGQAMARRLVREEGLCVGPSSGASVFAALRLARTLPPGSVVVTVLFDSGTRYLTDPFWDGAD